jgi:hypothetical protein
MDAPVPQIVADLFTRYLMSFDNGKTDTEWAESLFTPDIVVEFPMSRHEGIRDIDVYHSETRSRFAATQHLCSPPLVCPTGPDAAGLQAQVLSVHVHHGPDRQRFSAGTLATGEARRTPDGWRLSRLSFEVVWTDGRPA